MLPLRLANLSLALALRYCPNLNCSGFELKPHFVILGDEAAPEEPPVDVLTEEVTPQVGIMEAVVFRAHQKTPGVSKVKLALGLHQL